MTRHPYQWAPAAVRRRAFWLLLLANVVLIAALQVVGRPLITSAAPGGIVSFELAGQPDKARAIVDSWIPETRIYAGVSLGLDYLFMVAYASAIGLGCVLVTAGIAAPGRLATLGAGLAWAQWGAALLDAIENYALIQLLLGSESELWPALARWCAIPKFALVAAGLLFVIGVAAVVGLRRLAAGR